MFNLPQGRSRLSQGRVNPERGRGDLQEGRVDLERGKLVCELILADYIKNRRRRVR